MQNEPKTNDRESIEKTQPQPADVSPEYHRLIAWYIAEYCGVARFVEPSAEHSILKLRGLGRELWLDESADEYVARLRAGW